MKTLVAIRTHNWGADAQRLCDRLLPALGDRLVVVFHNRKGQSLPVPGIDIADGWPAGQGLFEPEDWGWRCGDYFLYALRQARPDADFYWLIEPDVHFTSDPAPFFAAFEAVTADLMGSDIAPFHERMRFARTLEGKALLRATFALTRMSGRLIDRLFLARQDQGRAATSARFYPNDELFSYTTANDLPGFTLASLEDHAPGWFEGTAIVPSPDRLLDEVSLNVPPGRVLHPVRSRDSLINALVGRVVDATAFLSRSQGALAMLTPQELDSIAFSVAQRLREKLALYQLRPVERQRLLRRQTRRK